MIRQFAFSLLTVLSTSFSWADSSVGICVEAALKSRVETNVPFAINSCRGIQNEGQAHCVSGALLSGVERNVMFAKNACSSVRSTNQGRCVAGALESRAESNVTFAVNSCSSL